MKYVIIPNNIKELDFYKDKGVDTFILGLENYCINYPSISLEIIERLSNSCNLFIAINKNIFNNEIADLKSKLISLSKLPILGVLFYDIGILNIVLENKIDVNLIWHQTHMVTNYNTCNYYNSKGVSGAFLANEITLDEIIEIRNKTNMELMVEIFGYPIMSHSRRSLLTNYFKLIDKEKEDRVYNLEDREEHYLIKENKEGTSILYGKLINGTRPLFELINCGIDYMVLDMQEVSLELGEKVIDKYDYILNNMANISDNEKEKIFNDMNNLIGESTNFFYKKTIYKVKRGII